MKIQEKKRGRGFGGYLQIRVREVNEDKTPIAPDVEPASPDAIVVSDSIPVSAWHTPGRTEL